MIASDPPDNAALTRLRELGGVASSAELQARLGVSQATVSRLLAPLLRSGRVLKVGAARSQRYLLPRAIEGVGSAVPMMRVDAQGQASPFGRMVPLPGGRFWVDEADGLSQLHDGLPWILNDMRPQGFMGRTFALAHPELRQDVSLARQRTSHEAMLQGGMAAAIASREAEQVFAGFLVERSKIEVSDATHELLARLAERYPLVMHGVSLSIGGPHALDPDYLQQQDMFWHSRREFADWAGGYSETGTEMYLSVVDRKFNGVNATDTPKDWVVQVQALCSNRNLPAYLPFGGGEPRFLIRKHADVIKEVRCLHAPTPSVRPALQEASRWQLVNHLTLNHFTGDDALNRLKETLQLYDFRCTPESKALIDGICGLRISTGTARVSHNGRVAVCSGSEILLEFTQSSYAGSGIYFFANILDVFFSQYATVNSYTRLSVKLKEHEQLYHRWPARCGNKVLL